MRNNIRTCLQIPQFANLTIYANSYRLTVTFNIKDTVIPYVTYNATNRAWNIDVFYKNNRHYITAILDIPFIKVPNGELDNCIWNYSYQMKKDLMILMREAKINEIRQSIKRIKEPNLWGE